MKADLTDLENFLSNFDVFTHFSMCVFGGAYYGERQLQTLVADRPYQFSAVRLAEMMIQMFTFEDYSLGSSSTFTFMFNAELVKINNYFLVK